jgi:hypothetical protein
MMGGNENLIDTKNAYLNTLLSWRQKFLSNSKALSSAQIVLIVIPLAALTRGLSCEGFSTLPELTNCFHRPKTM